MKIYIGSDHTGHELKKELIKYLNGLGLGYELKDKGPFSYDANDDYPDFIRPVAEAVAKNSGSFGVLLGGTGTGEAICANRIPGARAMVFYAEALPKEAIDIKGEKSSDPYEMVKLARVHNNANIISLSARFLSLDQIKFAIELFVKTPFLNEERHLRRIHKLG